MKNLLILILLFPSLLFAQTISTNVAISVPCCSHSDSIDYNLDGNYDVEIYSTTIIDATFFYVQALGADIQVSDPADTGAVFVNYAPYHSFAGTTLGCFGWYGWVPGTGVKYLGFRDISNPTDTIYGWIKADFKGMQDSCNDTIVTEIVTYNTVPNDPLLAGEVILTGTGIYELPQASLVKVFPNPAKDYLQVQNLQNIGLMFSLYDVTGKEVLKSSFINPNETKSIDVKELPIGVYYLKGSHERGQIIEKIILQK